MFAESVRLILDLLKLRKEEKKLDLEIEKLRREKAKDEKRIDLEIATLSQIIEFDPRTAAVMKVAKDPGTRAGRSNVKGQSRPAREWRVMGKIIRRLAGLTRPSPQRALDALAAKLVARVGPEAGKD